MSLPFLTGLSFVIRLRYYLLTLNISTNQDTVVSKCLYRHSHSSAEGQQPQVNTLMQAQVKALYLHREALPVYHVEIILSLSL